METATVLWAEQVLEQRDWLQRLARCLLASQDRADDLCQETIEQALRQPPKRRDNIRGWLATIMIRLKRAWERSAIRERARVKDVARRNQVEHKSIATPEDQMDRLERVRALREAVNRLDEPCRLVVHYRTWEGASFEQISRQLGVSEDAVRKRWGRALDRIRDLLRSAESK